MHSPLTFLVLDDNEDNRYLTRHALRKGFPTARVVEAGNTAEARAMAISERPDAILSDHHLGDAEGADFIRELRVAGVACPMVMITASSDPKVHRRAYDAGAAHVFSGGDLNFVAFLKARLLPPQR